MPRFYFHLHDNLVTPDEEGQVLPTVECAVEEAKRGAIELACAELQNGRLNLSHRIEVTDENGQVVAVVPFRDTVEVEG